MRAEATKSVNVTKTNTLRQFNTADIVGLPSPVGKVPIIFYVKETCHSGRRGIIYFNDLDTVSFMLPENEHAEWCEQPYDMKYDKVETWDNGTERGWRRKHGIFELWVSVLRKWYNGQIMYRPSLKIQGCGSDCDGYPAANTPEKEEHTFTQYQAKQPTTRPSCNCKKGE